MWLWSGLGHSPERGGDLTPVRVSGSPPEAGGSDDLSQEGGSVTVPTTPRVPGAQGNGWVPGHLDHSNEGLRPHEGRKRPPGSHSMVLGASRDHLLG